LGDCLWSALPQQFAAILAALRAQIDHVIGAFDDVQIMLDDDHGVAQIGQTLEQFQELFGIIEMESGSGFVETVE